MKLFMLCLFIISGCSSWKQKDFEKSIETPAKSETPDISAKDKKILEKFEVQEVAPVPEKKVEAPVVAAPKIVKPRPAPVVLKKTPAVVAPKKDAPAAPVLMARAEKKLPKNYPEELLAVNANAKKVWDVHSTNLNATQKYFLDIHYLGMTVGKIMVMNKGKQMMNGKEVWHLHARFKSAPFYSNIYELDNTVDSYVSTDHFLSSRYTLIQRESKQAIDDVQLYDRDQLKTFWFYKQKKSDGKVKNKEIKKHIPYYSIDPFSALFFFQGLPLKDGDNYEFPIINKAKVLLLTTTVEGREVIDTELGEKKAIRLHAVTKYSGDHLKSGDLYFWFSDDAERKLLKASAKIKIGSVTADIVKE